MKIEDMFPYFSSEVPGCPDETMRMAVERVFRELCTRAKVWTAWQDDIQLIDNQDTYDLDPPSTASLVESAFEAWVGQQLTPITIREVAHLMPDYQTSRSSIPRYFNTPEVGQTITVYPTPLGATLPLRVRGVYMPKRGITSIPDDIANSNMTLFERGAKSILMLQNKQPWTDVKMGDYWARKYENDLEEAAINQSKGNVVASDRVTPRRFGQ